MKRTYDGNIPLVVGQVRETRISCFKVSSYTRHYLIDYEIVVLARTGGSWYTALNEHVVLYTCYTRVSHGSDTRTVIVSTAYRWLHLAVYKRHIAHVATIITHAGLHNF